VKVKLVNVRLAFPVLWTPEPRSDDNPDEYFGANFLMPPGHPGIKLLEAAELAAIKDTFGSDWEKVKKEIEAGGPDRRALRQGDSKPNYDGFPGNFYVAAYSKTKPTVVNRNPKNPDGSPNLVNEADGIIYAGCMVDAIVDVFAYKKPKKGTSASLGGVQFRADGQAFGGGRPASADEFDDLSTGEEDSLA
jgi:hypothetical protein